MAYKNEFNTKFNKPDDSQIHKFPVVSELCIDIYPPDILEMNDVMTVYHCENSTYAVPISVLEKYRSINLSNNISLLHCPFSGLSIAMEGNYKPSGFLESEVSLFVDGSSNIINPLKKSTSPKHSIESWEANYDTLRNVLTEYPDCKYVSVKGFANSDASLSLGMLGYGIQYLNHHGTTRSSYVTSPSPVDKLKTLNNYLRNNTNALVSKNAFVLPMYKDVFIKSFRITKLIDL